MSTAGQKQANDGQQSGSAVAMASQLAGARKIVLGNWKMHGFGHDVDGLEHIAQSKVVRASAPDVMSGIAPPATLLSWLNHRLREDHTAAFMLGGQDCAVARAPGAHTGDVSARMLCDAGAQFVIVGHSERRGDHGESDAVVARKAASAAAEGLVVVVCVGETAGQRARGLTDAVLARQVEASVPADLPSAQLIVAYEPVWAIGTGLVPHLDDIAAAHAGIRATLGRHLSKAGDHAAGPTQTPLLYGGSVKASNAAKILHLDGADGALVGGASLKAASFLPIIEAAK